MSPITLGRRLRISRPTKCDGIMPLITIQLHVPLFVGRNGKIKLLPFVNTITQADGAWLLMVIITLCCNSNRFPVSLSLYGSPLDVSLQCQICFMYAG